MPSSALRLHTSSVTLTVFINNNIVTSSNPITTTIPYLSEAKDGLSLEHGRNLHTIGKKESSKKRNPCYYYYYTTIVSTRSYLFFNQRTKKKEEESKTEFRRKYRTTTRIKIKSLITGRLLFYLWVYYITSESFSKEDK